MYIVIRAFKDSMDNDRFYRVGDIYPAGGGKPNRKRVEELMLGTNRNGKMYIREEPEDGGKADPGESQNQPPGEEEKGTGGEKEQ